jgi:hypothetical protein
MAEQMAKNLFGADYNPTVGLERNSSVPPADKGRLCRVKRKSDQTTPRHLQDSAPELWRYHRVEQVFFVSLVV